MKPWSLQSIPSKKRLIKWGYASAKLTVFESTVSEALLLNRSPYLHDLSAEKLDEFRRGAPKCRRCYYLQISKALAALGITAAPLERLEDPNIKVVAARKTGNIHPEWLQWINRWEEINNTCFPNTDAGPALSLQGGRVAEAPSS